MGRLSLVVEDDVDFRGSISLQVVALIRPVFVPVVATAVPSRV